jgi:hypothetical protein
VVRGARPMRGGRVYRVQRPPGRAARTREPVRVGKASEALIKYIHLPVRTQHLPHERRVIGRNAPGREADAACH